MIKNKPAYSAGIKKAPIAGAVDFSRMIRLEHPPKPADATMDNESLKVRPVYINVGIPGIF